MAPHSKGFTLIELLVVITIIVVLLALLTPALDKAIYQAELLQDGVNIRTLASGGIQYAHDNKRHYPAKVGGGWVPNWIKSPNDYDHIKDLKPYAGVAAFNDPFVTGVDYSEGANTPTTILLGGQAVFFDWARAGSWDGIIKPIKRIGDRLTYDPIEDRGRVRQFSVLVSDLDVRVQGNGGVIIGHPDPNGGVPEQRFQNEPYPITSVAGFNIGKDPITLDWYIGGYTNTPNRGPLDLNYGYSDGSVLRLNGVEIDDDRVWHVIASADSPTRQQQLPRE